MDAQKEVILRLNKLTKNFGGLTAVNNVSLDIHRGVIHGLIGPNGSGKTTLINTVTGIYKASGGSIIFKDKEIKGLRSRLISELGISRTFQISRIFSRMTVLENLLVVAPKGGIKENVEKAMQLLKQVGLEENYKKIASSLPYGQRKLLEFARAVMTEPELIFLDEPTASLAPESAKVVRDLILNLAKESSKTFFIATHNLYEAEILCDRVAIINRGNILAVGKPKELKEMMKGETYTIIRFQEWNNEVENFLETNNYKISDLVQEERKIQIKLKDIEKETPPLIKKLIENNYNIVEVFHERPSLEKIYLELVERETNGGVK